MNHKRIAPRPRRIDLDVNGWELRQALSMVRKSDPPLLECLKSPIVYRRDPVFAIEIGALAAKFYCRSDGYAERAPRPVTIGASAPRASPRRCFAHYLHMAFGNWRNHLRGREEVSLKKYLYVFRPLLACRWIEHHLGQPLRQAQCPEPVEGLPMLFAQLVESVLDEADVHAALVKCRALEEFEPRRVNLRQT